MRDRIGRGAHKDVYVDSQRPKEVMAEFRRKLDSEQIKSAFYLNKIAHLLFPDNIPKAAVAGSKGKSYIRSERIELDQGHARAQQLLLSKTSFLPGELLLLLDAYKKQKDPNVIAFVKKAREAGLLVDEKGLNYSKLPNEPVKYLDLNPAWSYGSGGEIRLHFDSEQLSKAINNLPQTDREVAFGYLNRLNELVKQKQEELRQRRTNKLGKE